MTLKTISASVVLVCLVYVLATGQQKQAAKQFIAEPVWADGFDQPGLTDTSRWNYNTGVYGWGNDKRQYYTALANAWNKHCCLHISGKSEK